MLKAEAHDKFQAEKEKPLTDAQNLLAEFCGIRIDEYNFHFLETQKKARKYLKSVGYYAILENNMNATRGMRKKPEDS